MSGFYFAFGLTVIGMLLYHLSQKAVPKETNPFFVIAIAATITEVGGSGSFTGTHTYAVGGIYGIHVTLVDDDTGATSADTTAVITGVGIHDGVLQIIGTHGDDHVTVNQQGKGSVKVHASFITDRGGTRTLDFASVQSIEIVLGDGNDQATIAGNVARTTFI